MVILQATHTHLYPGHRGSIADAGSIEQWPVICDGVVEFSDGSTTDARLMQHADGWRLRTSPYRTAAGTHIHGKHWRIEFDEVGDHLEFRVLRG